MNDLPEKNDHRVVASAQTSATIAAEELASEAFGQWLDVELEKLVARWIHLAAPNATRSVRRSSRSF
jgi:hypothetical protein